MIARMREIAPRILIVFASLVIAVSLLEFPALFKLVDYGRIIGNASGDIFLSTNRGDPELLHIHPPHSHFSGSFQGGNITTGFRIPTADMTTYQWDVRYDEHGFRNDVDLKAADIVVIGDSFVESLTTPTPELTTSRLAELQHKVVANLGQYGYGPLEELAVLRRFGLPLHPRTVIWMFFEGNDLNDVLRYRKASVRGRTPQRFWSSFWERSFTINALAQIRKQYRQLSRPFGKKRSGTIGEPNAQQRTIYFVYSAPPLSSEQLDAFNQTLDTIATAHQLCANHASRLIFVFIPAKFRVFRDLCKFPEASECRKWSLNDLPNRMSKAIRAVSADIRYLDLTRDFIGSVRRGELPYYADDDHWSPEGHKVAAEAINAYLPSDSKQSPPHMIASRSELRQ